MNPYEILGVKKGASKQEIISAFRNKAKTCHPDVNRHDPSLEKKFKEINEAYRKLLALGDSSNGVQSEYGESFYSDEPTRINSVKEIHLTISEAMKGVHYKIDDTNQHCDTCNGEGMLHLKNAISCPYCKGTGNSASHNEGPVFIDVVCSHCAGTGRTTKRQCYECHGYGTKAGAGLVLDLPAGCLAGDSFVVKNGYSNRENNIIGDLELLISIKAERRFRVVGKDIETQVKLNVWDAVLGGKISVMGPDGEQYQLVIPSGTSHGRRFRLAGMGMRKYTNETEKGDLVVISIIHIPEKLTPKAKEAYERLRRELTAE